MSWPWQRPGYTNLSPLTPYHTCPGMAAPVTHNSHLLPLLDQMCYLVRSNEGVQFGSEALYWYPVMSIVSCTLILRSPEVNKNGWTYTCIHYYCCLLKPSSITTEADVLVNSRVWSIQLKEDQRSSASTHERFTGVRGPLNHKGAGHSWTNISPEALNTAPPPSSHQHSRFYSNHPDSVTEWW